MVCSYFLLAGNVSDYQKLPKAISPKGAGQLDCPK